MAKREGASEDDAITRLDELLSEYTDEIHALMYDVMRMVDARLPGATRMIYANWNATVVAYSPDGKSRHAACSVAAYPRWVNLFFAVGPDLPDPHGLLQGTGSTIRSVRITASSDLDERVQALLDAAIDMGPWEYDPRRLQSTIVVSISDKRRPHRAP